MMDEMWSRGWSEAHKAALQARDTLEREGRPVPTLWEELRMLVRDLITPPQPKLREAPRCDAETCQSAA
jgi:hypothetical protein